jgi:predicted sugar kinase
LIINEQFLNKQDEVKRQVELIADKELSKHTGIGKITSMQLSHNIGVLLLDYKMKIK